MRISLSNEDAVDPNMVIAAIRATIPVGRPVDIRYNDTTLFYVDLPDATADEAATVEADLRAQFPAWIRGPA
jgi:hypothetical protein